MDPLKEKFQMEHAGMLARSAQGHAAKGMKIKDQEDMWVSIQHNTFRNWVNVQLRDTGLRVENLSEDLRDGVALVTVVETLQKRRLRKITRVLNQHQALENVTTALNAIADDGIKLVNIGNVDIVNGNLKLILGLIWSLIMHYQIGQTKFPPKKLMLSWLKAVLPGCEVNNFTSNWNSGINLSALVDYCRPGLFRNWKNLNPENSVDNCRKAMEIANREFHIPMVLEPEYLASPYLDDLSGMTYLSYFMKEGGPGYKATLDWVQKMLPEKNIKNFTTEWNDGHNLATLVKKLGGPVPGYKTMPRDERHWEKNIQTGLDGGKKLGVTPVLAASDMARPDVEYLGPMAYLSYFQWVRPRKSATESIRVRCDLENTRINNPVPFRIDFLSKDAVESELRVDVNGPSGPVRIDIDSSSRGARGSFIPKEVGFYELQVTNEEEHVEGSPCKVRALPDVSKIMFSGIDPCALGSIVEVLINSNGAGGGDIDVMAISPTRRSLVCPVKEEDGVYTATFQPDEAGEWSIEVTYDDEHIQGSPFSCHVYDPNAIKVYKLDYGPMSSPGKPFTFIVDASACGWGDAKIDVTNDGKSVPSKTLEIERSVYEVTFTPLEATKYKVYVYFNGHETRGSPFPLYLGVEKPPERKSSKSKKKKSKNKEKDVTPIIKEYTSIVDSPKYNTNSLSRNAFNKTFDSSLSGYKKNSALNKSYESTLDETKTSTRNYQSLTKTRTSSLNKSSESILNKSSNDILSRDYSKTLDKFKDRTRTLSFDFPTQRTTFDIPINDRSDKHHSSSLKKNSLLALNRNATPDTTMNTSHNSSFNSTMDSVFNSSATTVIDTGYSSSSKKYINTSYDKHSSRLNSSPMNHSNYISDGIRSPKSPIGRSPMESPRSSPLRQTSLPPSSPEPIPGLSSPSKVLQAGTVKGSKNVEDRRVVSSYVTTKENGIHGRTTKSEYEEFQEDVSNYPTSTIKTKTKIYKSEERLISSPGPSSPLSPHTPRSPLSSPFSPVSLPSSPVYPAPLNSSSSTSSLRKGTSQTGKTYLTSTSSVPNVSTTHYSSSALRDGSINVPVQVTYSHGNLTSPTRRSPPHSKVHTDTYSSSTWERSGYRSEKTDHHSLNKTTIDITDSARDRIVGSSPYYSETSSRLRHFVPDPKKIVVAGSGVRLVSVGDYAELVLTSSEKLFEQSVNVTVTGPGRRNVPVNVDEGKAGELLVSFKPLLVGEYPVDIRVGQEKIPGSPFRCYVYNAREIKVGRIPNGVVGQPVEFEIDGSTAGSGNLEILVNGGHVTSNVRNLGQQRFLASFVPHSAITHSVEMKFNEEKVPGSPWSVNVMESPTARVSVMGEAIRHFPAGQLSSFDVSAPGIPKEDIQVHIVSPAKRPVSYQLKETSDGLHQVSFATSEVGSYVVEVVVSGQKVQGSPFIAKAYDAGLIRVSDVPNGVVGEPCQFRVDASQAGEGQLEISINDGEVPNHVQVLGGGRCLVSFTPDTAKTHTIDIKFNGETVRGCPFVCRVSDTSRVSLTLRHLELIPVGQPAAFNIAVDRGGSAELTVTVRTPSHTTLPVRVSGSVRQGFSAEFTPVEVGAHTIIVNYNDLTVSGTPFTCKVYDASKVGVSHLPRGAIGKTLQFIVDASEAGEGNLEISISAAGRNIPTQVHPQGSARFAVAFVPLEAIDHIINISFNKEPVPGSPFVAKVQADPNRIVVSGQALAATAVNKPSFFTISNVTGSVEDVEVSVEGPSGIPVAAQVRDNKDGTFRVEYSPRSTGEHRIHVSYAGENIPGSPFCCKVYDVNAIKVRPAERGMVGKPVTFLVETNNAGPGNLEVTVNGGQVPTGAQAQGNHVYAISFTPKEAKPHVVELSFNGENVPGSPFTCTVVDVSRVTVSGAGLEKVPVDSVASFIVDTQATVDQLKVNILSPSRNVIDPKIVAMGDGKIKVEYTPTEVGDYGLEIRVGGVLVPGAPFLVKAYDSNKVKVTDVTSGIVAKPVYFSIDASQAGAGNLEIIVSVNGRNVPNYVQSEGHAKFRVNFKPKEAAIHTLSVKFNGDPVPGSPFECRVTDSSHVVVSGNGIKMTSIARSANFTVDPRGAEVGNCDIQVTSPSGARVPVRIEGELPKKLTVEFQPLEVGPHTVNVYIDGETVGGSPFTCNVYDVTKVNVTGLENTKVNRPVTFTVDASQAGEGTLELVVTTAKASVRAEVAARSRGLYDVTFTPHEPIAHFVNITFNEEEVLGSPFKCEVRELEPREIKNLKRKESQMVTAKGEGLKQIVAGNLASFTVDTKGLEGDLDIQVTGPNGERIPAKLFKMRNGLHRTEYSVTQVGSYNVAVLHQNVPISGTPFLVEAADPTKVHLHTTSQCFSGQECGLRVDASGAGRGSLSVGVKAAGQDIKHSIRDLGGGMYQVLFYPRVPIPHKVDVRYNGIPVKGAPFEIPVRNPATGQTVTATGLGLHHARVNKAVSFVIETLGRSSKEFDVIITGPHDWAVPVKCYQQKDGNLLAEYTPHTPGNYQIDVLCAGKHVRGSPFTCTAYDASKVVLEQTKANISVEDVWVFKMDKSEAGVADMDVQVITPSGRSLPLEVKSTPTNDIVEWQPEAPGQYKVEVSYGGEEVPGSPIYVDVGESGLASVSGPGLLSGKVDTPAIFTIDGRGLLGEPQVTVDGPDSVARVTIRQQDEGLYQVTYVPHEVGIFDIRVQWNKKDVSGSPFHPKIVDLKKVRLIGGWESLRDDEGKLDLIPREEKRLTFDVSEAGPGRLKSEVIHDGKVIESLCEHSGSRVRVLFTPPTDGQYELKFWYNDLPLPESPLKGWVPSSTAGDHTRVTLRGHGLTSARCGAESEFIIDGSGAGPGTPDVTMSGTKTDIHVGLASEGNGVWHAKYTPIVAGAYLLNVMWNDRQVRGCPLKVIVESVADSSKVLCSGDGLRHGMVGQEIKSFIDTRRAGPGELTARCVGPHKVAVCELYDHRDGTFTLNIRPHEPGRHHLSIMYEGEHVPGSPYTLKIAGAPDASKVRVYGPGIEHGVLASYQSRFICDTRGAGAGQLTVKIRGPKGAFRVEMQRESQKDRTILCKYDPTEPGDYRVEVKWSGENVPGSPFVVMIFDTQEELNRYMAGGYSPSGAPGGGPSDNYGSIGYGYGAVNFGQMSWRGSQAQL